MKLWVDDIRRPPDETWQWAKNFGSAMCRDFTLFDVISLELGAFS